MNFAMWRKALNVIPDVSKSEWDQLDVISKWLISTRAAVLIMTFISAALAGLFAWRDNSFSFLPWLALTLGLILARSVEVLGATSGTVHLPNGSENGLRLVQAVNIVHLDQLARLSPTDSLWSKVCEAREVVCTPLTRANQ